MDLPDESFRGIVETVPAQIALLDSSGEIRYTNQAWQNFARENGIIGDTASIGANYLRVCEASGDDEFAAEAKEGLESVLSGDRRTFRFEYPCHSPAENRWFMMYATRFSVDGDTYAHVGHIDITERKEAELAVRRQNDRLESVASILSHDLRSPLNVATATVDMIEADAESPDERFDDVRASLRRMDAMLSDALSFARQTVLDDVEPVSLRTAAKTAWGHVPAEDATLDVVDEFTFEADASVLPNLFENLFRNSVEHGGPSTTVRVGVLDAGEGFYVEDDGPGIPDEDVSSVFDPGYSTGESDANAGFGLAIVETIADGHGWSVAVTDSADGGARFEFSGVDRCGRPDDGEQEASVESED